MTCSNSIYSGISALTLACLIGYFIGRIVSIQLTVLSASPIHFTSDTRSTVPVVSIEGVRNGQLEGRMSSGVRLFVGEEYVIPTASGTFNVAAEPVLVNRVTVDVPADMYFVASRKGTRYYSVTSSQGMQITPVNRVYFHTREEAKGNGYR